jgi:hypothetical protein
VAAGHSHIGQIVVAIEQVPTQNSSTLPQHRRLTANYAAQVKRAQTVNQTLWRACPLAIWGTSYSSLNVVSGVLVGYPSVMFQLIKRRLIDRLKDMVLLRAPLMAMERHFRPIGQKTATGTLQRSLRSGLQISQETIPAIVSPEDSGKMPRKPRFYCPSDERWREILCLNCACEAHLATSPVRMKIGGQFMQNGSIIRTGRRRGPDVWEFRWRAWP